MNANDSAFSDRLKGSASEERFVRLLSDPSKLPKWIMGVVPSGPKGDVEMKFDYYVIGEGNVTLRVQIKSSVGAIKGYVRSGGPEDVCIVVMNDGLDDDPMREHIVQILEKWKTRFP